MKRFASLILAALLMTTMSSGAFAVSAVKAEGTIVSVDAANSTVTVNTKTKGEVVFLVGSDSSVLDNATGKPIALSALKAGMTVTAWHSEAMTRSLPPQTNLFAMIVTTDAEKAFGHDFEVGSVEKNADGSVRLFNKAGDLYLTIAKDASVKRLTTSGLSAVKAADIKPGAKLIAWYEVVLTSYPGQAGTDAVMVLSMGSDNTPDIPQTGSEATGLAGAALCGGAALCAGAMLKRRKENN